MPATSLTCTVNFLPITAGVQFSVTATANAPVTGDTAINITVKTGPGALLGTHMGTILAGQTSVTIGAGSIAIAVAGSYVLTASRTSGDILTAGDSASFDVSAGAASRFVITGTGTQVPGTSQNITITATDGFYNTDPTYGGDKVLTFSGAAVSPNGTHPTVTDKTPTARNFGVAEIITFTAGVATRAMKLYTAEVATVDATASGVTTSLGDGLSVTMTPVFDQTVSVLGAPIHTFPFAITIALIPDAYGNAVTTQNTSFAISVNTGAGSLSGTITGTMTTGTSAITITPMQYSIADTGVVLTSTETAGDTVTTENSNLFNVISRPAGSTNVFGSGPFFATRVDSSSTPVVGTNLNTEVRE